MTHDVRSGIRHALAFTLVSGAALFLVTLPSTIALLMSTQFYGVGDSVSGALRFHGLSTLLILWGVAWALCAPLPALLGSELSRRWSAGLCLVSGMGAAGLSLRTLLLHEPFAERVWMPIPFAAMGIALAALFFFATRARDFPRLSLLAAAAAMLGVVAVELTDTLVLPTTYDTFHAAVRVAGLALAQVTAVAVVVRLMRRPRPGRVLSIAAALVVAAHAPLLFVTPASRVELARIDKHTTLDQHTSEDAFFITKAMSEVAREACRPDDVPTAPVPLEDMSPRALVGRDMITDLRPTRHVLLITIEALRYRYTSLGADGEASGPLAKWAKRGVLFEKAYSPSPKTLTSISSYMTLKHPSQIQLEIDESSHWLGKLDERERTLSDAAGADGRHTFAAVHGRHIGDDILGFDQGFETFRRTSAKTMGQKRRADELTLRHARRLIEAHAEDDPGFFGWVFFVSPHSPYFMRDGKLPKPRHTKDTVEAYETEVAYAEGLVDDLLSRLEELDLLDETTVVITGDHGEAVGDHDMYGHRLLYEHQLRTPFIVLHPDAEPSTLDAPVQTLHGLAWAMSTASGELGAFARERLTHELGSMSRAVDGLVLAETISSRQVRASLIAPDAKVIYKSKHGTSTFYDLIGDPDEERGKSHPKRAGIAAARGIELSQALLTYQNAHACQRNYSFGHVKKKKARPKTTRPKTTPAKPGGAEGEGG